MHLEPDALELELEPEDYPLPKRHTMPAFTTPQTSGDSNVRSPQLSPISPKRAETFPSSQIEELNRAKHERLIRELISRIEPDTHSSSSQEDSQLLQGVLGHGYTNSVAQSNPIDAASESPVPAFFFMGSTPAVAHTATPPDLYADNLTPEDQEASPDPFGNYITPKELQEEVSNDNCSIIEDHDSIPPTVEDLEEHDTFDTYGDTIGQRAKMTSVYSKAPVSDSGMGSSITTNSRYGPHSVPSQNGMSVYHGGHPRSVYSKEGGRKFSMAGSQKRGSVYHEKDSVSGSVTNARYKQYATQLAPPLSSAVAPSAARKDETRPMLSQTAVNTMKKIILEPILGDKKFCAFWDVCTWAGEQIESGRIGSLRDLEKFLFHKASNAKHRQGYNTFCTEFLSHIKHSLAYMPPNELHRTYDRPYDNGYFLDTLAQFNKNEMSSDVDLDSSFQQLLDNMQQRTEKRVAEEHVEHAISSKRIKPNVPLFNLMEDRLGNLQNNYEHISNNFTGSRSTQPANQTGAMLPPPLPIRAHPNAVDAFPKMNTTRSKGKRRGPTAVQKEPQHFQCDWEGCPHGPFARLCDLTKHKKTHTRPHKCQVAGCKYATEGFPTEKERDRHWIDKHSSGAPEYQCSYHPCQYRSKRESNCKQHMEKAHGYEYKRTKQNYKLNGTRRQQKSPTNNSAQVNTAQLQLPSHNGYYAEQHFVPGIAPQANGHNIGHNDAFDPYHRMWNGQTGYNPESTIMGTQQEQQPSQLLELPKQGYMQQHGHGPPFQDIGAGVDITSMLSPNIDPTLYKTFSDEHLLGVDLSEF
ncbi:hypothetical protein BDZ91DRAFT_127163 [Kalaharituber pfeilii]|nr:hypothetical protein BDZ91DRAFT_127163 [Kalaharituber pfeilii]